MRKKWICGILLLCLACGCGAGTEDETEEKTTFAENRIKIGFSQPDIKGAWRVAQLEDIQREAEDRGYELMAASAEEDAGKQAEDIERMLNEGCEGILVSPVDTDKISETLELCAERHVPVFLIDRMANAEAGRDYVTAILSDLAGEGEQIAYWASEKLRDMGVSQVKAVEITGKVGGSDTRDRAMGFRRGAEALGNIEIAASQSGEFSRAEAAEVMKDIIIATDGDFDLVFCHNDEMALGAYISLENAGMEVGREVLLCSIDGQEEAFEAILAGKLSCTVTCSPLFGKSVFDTFEKYRNGEEVPARIINEDILIDSENVWENMELAF
ncbi:ABC transporter substrate-binding protein [Lacrimispora sp. NSJ-141]|uniref:ABC transporter substrate-binding protein n=1 Tax=Lientehia hominis TaxID=2897778 RepID=A0AAP2RJJ4_9FIRM|nr:ABC transporter substrate-binding protein [Lientehia hominis]MCD2493367.1 ABC transporter substrate-binding protein [Lientehia hominis]